MGKKVVLAPRNSAEAVALGVSACFLAVAGVVVHGNSSLERAAQPSTTNLAASVEAPRTISRPASYATVNGSRVPVLTAEPPLVLLPVGQQVAAKLAAAGTERGDGVILVSYRRGAGTLPLGGGLPGVITAAPSTSATRLNGAVIFPTSTTATTTTGTVTAAPPVETTAPPVETTAPPVEITAPPVETTARPVETTPPPVQTTPPPVQTTPPTGSGPGGSTDAGSGSGSTGSGSGPESGSGTTADTEAGAPTTLLAPDLTQIAPGPKPEGPKPLDSDV